MLGHIVPSMEPSISSSTTMDSTTVGRAPKAPAPLLWRRPKAASILVDGEIDGSMYGATYPSIYGSEDGARNNNPSGRIINSGGRIIVRPLVNYNFGYESGPHGSPRHDTLSQRSATPPPSFLSPSQAPKKQFSTNKSKKSKKIANFPLFFPISLFGVLRWGHWTKCNFPPSS